VEAAVVAPTALLAMTLAKSLETTRIYRVAGRTGDRPYPRRIRALSAETTRPARARHIRPSPPCAALDPARGTGRLNVEVEGVPLVLRQRKVDATVVEDMLTALQQTPLAGPTEVAERVNTQWGRQDLTHANTQTALEQIPCVPVLRTLRPQLAGSQAHYREAYPVRGGLSLDPRWRDHAMLTRSKSY
jgi:hypothetical protein